MFGVNFRDSNRRKKWEEKSRGVLREAPAGFEPANRGFADLPLSHLGTAPYHLLLFFVELRGVEPLTS